MRKLVMLLSVLALAAFAVAACGGDDESSDETAATTTTEETTAGGGGGGGGGTASIEADPDGALAFTSDSVSAPAGEVTIEFDNPSSVGHDVVVEDADGNELIRTDIITGDSTSASGELEQGEFTFFCSVPGHREAGMEGTLTAE